MARAYLISRDLTLDQATELGLGYAPRGAAFADAMQALGIEEAVLLEAGLLRRKDDGVSRARDSAGVCCSRFTTCAGAWSRSAAVSSGTGSRST